MWVLFAFVAVVVVLLIVIGGSFGAGSGGTSLRDRLDEEANDRAGRIAESIVNSELEELLKDDEYLLNNLLLPLRNGRTTEIDTILISRKGVFCIETKSWMGAISGNDEDDYWLQTYKDKGLPPRRHRNPVKQNKNHCHVLKEILKGCLAIENIVIFFDLEDGSGIDSDYVYEIDEFIDAYNCSDEVLSSEAVGSIYQKLKPFVATKEQLQRHKMRLRKQHND